MQNKKVKIRAFDDGAGGVDFEVDGIKAKHASMKLPKDSGDHAIEFQLQDHSGRGLQFDPADPIWVDEDCPCPPREGLNSDQLIVTSTSGSVLATINENAGRARDLRYQLNFVAKDGSRSECDPVIQNGGGVRP